MQANVEQGWQREVSTYELTRMAENAYMRYVPDVDAVDGQQALNKAAKIVLT